MVWYSHLFQKFPQFVVIHTVKGFGIVNKAEIDVFLELSCFFNDPADVGNLISGSSAFSKTNLNIWKFTVQVLLKPGLETFEHYFTTTCKIDSQRENDVLLRKLKQGLCINPEGWDGEEDEREVQEGGDICIPMADSC